MVAGWLLVTGAAVALGVFATGLIGRGLQLGATHTIPDGRVKPALTSASGSPAAHASRHPQARKSGAGPPSSQHSHPAKKVIKSKGGSVLAQCIQNKAYLLRWTAAQGYSVDDDDDDLIRGPAQGAKVKFESDDWKYTVSVGCRDGVPTGVVTTEED